MNFILTSIWKLTFILFGLHSRIVLSLLDIHWQRNDLYAIWLPNDIYPIWPSLGELTSVLFDLHRTEESDNVDLAILVCVRTSIIDHVVCSLVEWVDTPETPQPRYTTWTDVEIRNNSTLLIVLPWYAPSSKRDGEASRWSFATTV